MGTVNLAIVFGPGLCHDTNKIGLSQDLGYYQQIVKLLISHVDQVFPQRQTNIDISGIEADTRGLGNSSGSADALLVPDGLSPRPESPRSPFSPRKSLEEFRSVVSQSGSIR